MKEASENILKSLQETIDKARKAMAGLDRGTDPAKYRQIHKRLKRAQRNLTKWKKVSARLEERMKSKKKEKAAPAAAPAPEEPAKKEEASGEKPATESAPTS